MLEILNLPKERLHFSLTMKIVRQIELNIYLSIGISYMKFQSMTIDSRIFGSKRGTANKETFVG